MFRYLTRMSIQKIDVFSDFFYINVGISNGSFVQGVSTFIRRQFLQSNTNQINVNLSDL